MKNSISKKYKIIQYSFQFYLIKYSLRWNFYRLTYENLVLNSKIEIVCLILIVLEILW